MATNSPLQGIPLPESTDADNVPYDLANAVDAIEKQLVMKFTTATARDAAIPTPTAGMVAYLTTPKTFTGWDGVSWKTLTTSTDLATKANTSHTHAESDVTSLAADLAAKANASDLAAKANASHSHTESDVSGLASDLAGKAAASHTHTESDVSGLASDLAGKAAASHTHAYSALTSKPLTVIGGGQATLSFSSGAATLAHGLGTAPISVAVTSVSGGGTNVVVMLSGPTSSDGTNIYLRATNVNASTNFTGSATFTWIAFA